MLPQALQLDMRKGLNLKTVGKRQFVQLRRDTLRRERVHRPPDREINIGAGSMSPFGRDPKSLASVISGWRDKMPVMSLNSESVSAGWFTRGDP